MTGLLRWGVRRLLRRGSASVWNPPTGSLADRYEWLLRAGTDISAHLPTLRRLSAECDTVVEFGTRRGVSTTAILLGQPRRLICYDLQRSADVDWLATRSGATTFEFHVADTRTVAPPACDLLLIDTLHNGDQLRAELRSASAARRYLVLHDVATFGFRGETAAEGLLPAVFEFLAREPAWRVREFSAADNGLLVLAR